MPKVSAYGAATLPLVGTETVYLVQGGNSRISNVDAIMARVAPTLNATGSAPMYACRAWVNFNGTGVVAIRASGNVSSITDNGVGDYTVNFTTAMQDANYAANVTAGSGATAAAGNATVGWGAVYAAGSLRIGVSDNNTDTNQDASNISVAIFR